MGIWTRGIVYGDGMSRTRGVPRGSRHVQRLLLPVVDGGES